MAATMTDIPLEGTQPPTESRPDLERGVTSGSTSDPLPLKHQGRPRTESSNTFSVEPSVQPWVRWLKAFYAYSFVNGFGMVFCIPMIIPLVLVAQHKTFNKAMCTARQNDCGFEGNEDAYGLGIRLGAYLQWIASSLVTNTLPSEERPLMGAMSVFSTALMVAILVLTFSRDCTYSIEIIVMLFIIVTNHLLISLTKTARGILAMTERFESDAGSIASLQSRVARMNSFLVSSDQSRGVHGWNAGTTMVDILVMAYAAWFWIRMAVGSDETFEQTPCGTSIFLIVRVKSSGIPIASGVIAAYCFLMLVYQFAEWALNMIFPRNIANLVHRIMFLPISLPLIVSILIVILPWAFLQGILHSDETESLAKEYFATENMIDRAVMVLGPAMTVVSIIGIELSLIWNGVSNVYSVESTGQLIPLCVGFLSLLPLLWKLLRRKLVGKTTRQIRTTDVDEARLGNQLSNDDEQEAGAGIDTISPSGARIRRRQTW